MDTGLTMAAPVTEIPLAQIAFSPTNPRKSFDPEQLRELCDSLARHGMLQPVLVRPMPSKRIADQPYELVCGERRCRAALMAQIASVPAFVRELSDLDAIEIQVVENLQRADLHPLEEADGYEKLIHYHGYAAEDIAGKIGKSKSYVYARLKLASLVPLARELFFAGKLTASTALLVARIGDADAQAKAAQEIAKPLYGDDEPLSYREAARHVQNKYMTELARAPFKLGDAELLPAAGTCKECPKRTGNQPELFGDVGSADVCTDPSCFNAKKAAHFERLKARAREDGREVLTGKAAKAAGYDRGLLSSRSEYVELDDRCWDDEKGRHWRKLLGKEAEQITALI